MLIWIMSSKIASEKIISHYEMKKFDNIDDLEIYKSHNKILVVSDESNIDKDLVYLYSEFNPQNIFYFWLSETVSSEHIIWDIILPNTFFELNEKIEETQFYKDNIDSFLKNPIFIENYSLQNDYDFEKFWLSIGWICVSGEKDLTPELKDKVKIAYEADIYDKYSYFILNEAKKMWISERFYVINAIYDKDNLSWINEIIENWIYILNFVLDNITDDNELEIEI